MRRTSAGWGQGGGGGIPLLAGVVGEDGLEDKRVELGHAQAAGPPGVGGGEGLGPQRLPTRAGLGEALPTSTRTHTKKYKYHSHAAPTTADGGKRRNWLSGRQNKIIIFKTGAGGC